jgi:PRC-barrel domain
VWCLRGLGGLDREEARWLVDRERGEDVALRGGGLGALEHPAGGAVELAEWHGADLVDRDGEKIGKLEEVYVDVETDEPKYAVANTQTKQPVANGPRNAWVTETALASALNLAPPRRSPYSAS